MTSKSDKNKRGMYTVLSATIITIVGLVQILFFEKIPINNGLGFDGVGYADMVKHADKLFSSEKPSDYYAARALPSLIVHWMLKTARTPITNQTIVAGFGVFNVLLLIVAAIEWGFIADEVGLSNGNKWLGFVFLFFNFALLKMTWYYPVLTDTAAFTVALLLLYAYLKQSASGIALCGLLGAFIWQIIMCYAVILYLFPRNTVPILSKNGRVHYFVFGLVTLAVLAVFIRYYGFMGMHTAGSGTQSVRLETLPMSIIGLMLYLFFSFSHLLKNISIRNVSFMLLPKTFRKTAVVIIVLFCLNLFIHHIATNGEFGIKQVGVTIVIGAILNPLIFLVAHVVYFGPIALLAIVWFKDIARLATEYGLGMVALFAATIPLTIFSESRCCIALLPFVAALTMLLLQRNGIKMKWSIAAVVLTVLFSKIWLPIGMNEELYYMNFGPWMPEKWYCLQGIIAAAIAGAMLYLKKTKQFFVNEQGQ